MAMKFRGDEYFFASLERISQALHLHRAGRSYALAIYCGGLAVECMLRAFRWERDPEFTGRHDLEELLQASGLVRINEEHLQRHGVSPEKADHEIKSLSEALKEVVALWHNNLRFA